MVKGIGGRPPKTEESLIDRELRPYFQMGVSAKKASLQTGYNYNTCKVRWAEWKSNPDADHLEEISERQRKSTAQFMEAYDEILVILNNQLTKYNKLVEDDRTSYETMKAMQIRDKVPPEDIVPYTPNKELEDKVTDLSMKMADILDRKTAVLNAPYIDEDSEAATLARLTKKIQEQREKNKKI